MNGEGHGSKEEWPTSKSGLIDSKVVGCRVVRL